MKQILFKNFNSLNSFQKKMNKRLSRGDIIYRSTISDDLFFHEGIYIGENKVVHITSRNLGIFVISDSLEKFARNKTVKIKNTSNIFTNEEIAKRAESKIGQRWPYDTLLNNCESFTNYISTGEKISLQGNLTLNLASFAGICSYKKKRDFISFILGTFEGILISRMINKYIYS